MADNNRDLVDSLMKEGGNKFLGNKLDTIANQGYKVGFGERSSGWNTIFDILRCVVFYVLVRKFIVGELDGVFLVFLALFFVSLIYNSPVPGTVEYDPIEDQVVKK